MLERIKKKNSSDILLTELLEFEHINRKEIAKFECDSNVINITIKGKSTMIFTDYFLYSHHCKSYFEYIHNFSLNSENIQFESDFNVFHYLYLAKFTSKQPYQSDFYVCTKSYPKSAIMISLMLLMCGDTGALINPGPKIDCSYCDKLIRYNSNFLSCQFCNCKVHLKCNNSVKTPNFICYLCTDNFLPSSLSEDIEIADKEKHVSNENLKSLYENENFYEKFNKKGLHFIHANVRSLYNKMSEVRYLSRKTNVAVLAITESWLDGSYTDDAVKIDGYSIQRRDREGHAGGICVYIRDDIAFNRRSDLENEELEDLWVEILLTHTKPIYLGVCYRNEKNNNLLKCLDNTFSKIRPDCDSLVLGDFNICILKNKTKLCKDYKSLLTYYNCKQLVHSPTRVTEKTSTLLDHIFTNNIEKISQSGVLPMGLSDHFLTYCTRKSIRGHIGTHKTISIRSLKSYSITDFLTRLRNTNWTDVTRCNDVNIAWLRFKEIFTNILNEVAPIKKVRINTRTEPWMSSEILKLISKRDKALNLANKYKSNTFLREEFNELRNKVQREIKKAKSNFFKDKIEENKNNPKKLWKQFKSLGYSSKSKVNSKIVLNIDNNICFQPKQIAQYMQNYFLNVASALVSKLPSPLNIFSTDSNLLKTFYMAKNVRPNSFMLNTISEQFVNTELSQLNINKSTGFDEIPARFLKDGSSEIKEVVTYLINLSICKNEFPDELKYAIVKPLFKKNKKTEVENYRPVSVLCIISKILEKAVHSQLDQYLNKNKILYSHQSGFRKGHSTDTCLINLMDYIHKGISEGDYVGMVLLDLQKAFDTVDHSILCEKFKLMGVGCVQWFKSYLSNRKQIVTVNNSQSISGIVTCGVPQGSILGPLLFLCYINDMPLSVKCKLYLYADDSTLLVQGKQPTLIAQALSENLDRCRSWLIDNKLSLHLGKTEAILFGTKRKLKNVNNFQVKCGNTIINNVKSVKYLGLTLDADLSGESIVSNILKKAGGRLKFLYRHSNILNLKARKTLCSALIQCYFDYSCSSWYMGLTKRSKQKLQIMQNKMIRFILKLNSRSHIGCNELENVNMLSVSNRVKQIKLNHVYKIWRETSPEYMFENFNRISDTELRNCTRASINNFFLPRVQGNCINIFFYSGIKAWNSLPAEIKHIQNESTFKDKVKRNIALEARTVESCPFLFF